MNKVIEIRLPEDRFILDMAEGKYATLGGELFGPSGMEKYHLRLNNGNWQAGGSTSIVELRIYDTDGDWLGPSVDVHRSGVQYWSNPVGAVPWHVTHSSTSNQEPEPNQQGGISLWLIAFAQEFGRVLAKLDEPRVQREIEEVRERAAEYEADRQRKNAESLAVRELIKKHFTVPSTGEIRAYRVRVTHGEDPGARNVRTGVLGCPKDKPHVITVDGHQIRAGAIHELAVQRTKYGLYVPALSPEIARVRQETVASN